MGRWLQVIQYTNECMSCAVPGFPCVGDACEYRHYPHFICDKCGEEVDHGELFYYDGEELCGECILESLEVVNSA